MTRRLLNLLTALSLLMCAAVYVLWGRSHRYPEVAWYLWNDVAADGTSVRRGLQLLSHRGRLVFVWTRQARSASLGPLADGFFYRTGVAALSTSNPALGHAGEFREFAGLGYGTYREQDPRVDSTAKAVAVPHWLLAAATAPAPLLWLLRWRRRIRREIEGLCPHCGYDLRATPDRCPECGRAAAQ